MVTKKQKKIMVEGLYWFSILTVISTHVYMLFEGLPQEQMFAHSVINLLAAAAFIAYDKLK